ncbi:MAG TPA: POTRA domain-containing protein, partial [Candidatus Cloacimonadota bacterium]|nr:POTRA domain-containing protein [Candidatus Cloacimonadota bacterium]
MKRQALIVLFMLVLGFLYAQNQLILDIEIMGNQNIETDLISSIITLEIGDMLDMDKVSKSINSLYQLGVFEDVRIEYTNLPQGIALQIYVKEFPVVKKISFAGLDKLSDTKLLEAIDLREGSYWSPFLQKEIQNSIVEEYKKKGYHLAEINFTEEPVGENQVDVVINVNENSKVTIKSIRLHGNKLIQSKKLIGKLKTKKASLFRSGKFEDEKFDEDLINLVTYYNKKGFIDARVISWERNLVDDKFVIDIYLYEGKEYNFGKVFVEGNERFTDDMITSNFKFNVDEVFDLEKFNKQLSAVTSMYYEEGYIYANFDHELERNENLINIRLNI